MIVSAYHNSHDPFYRNPFGAVECCKKITLRLQVSNFDSEKCYLRLWEEDQEKIIPMVKVSTAYSEQRIIFEVSYITPYNPGLVWYYFILSVDGKDYFYGNNALRLGGEGQLWEEEPPAYQLTVYFPMHIPKWYKQGVMYQIYVDRFFNGNQNYSILNARKGALIHADWSDIPFYIKDEDGRVIRWNFFGGNLKGIIDKLDYLKELGISIIYLNPIFSSPSNHKYDTANYKEIDPMYGDEVIFEQLCREAKEQGISIVLDGVFSHTGSDSIYFNKYGNYSNLGAYQSAHSPYYKWFKFKENKEYECWWGIDDLPEVNELEPSYRQFIYGAKDSVIQKWMEKGVKGWRLDVADELPDEFIQELRQVIKKIDSESILIGEVWNDATNKVSYGKLREYFWGNELDSTMNYPFREIFVRFLLKKIDAQLAHQKVMNLYENYPRENFFASMNLIGSHDRARILTILGEAPHEETLSERERETYRLTSSARLIAIQRLKLLVILQMSFPGVPCIYYGDEAGVEGYGDPYNRGTFPWGREDQELLNWYKKIIRIRREYSILQSGDFISFAPSADVYGIKRIDQNEEIIILINRNLTQVKDIWLGFKDKPVNIIIDLVSGKTLAHGKVEGLKIKINPLEGKVLFCKRFNFNNRIKKLKRSCGVLMHMSSLPSPWGIGDLGEEAYKFIDFLAECNQKLWQVLPLNPVGLGDSPYQSESAFAGNMMLISIDHLIEEGLLRREDMENIYNHLTSKDIIEFYEISKAKMALLSQAFGKFKSILNHQGAVEDFLSLKNYLDFTDENRGWLDNYSLFRAIKLDYGQNCAWFDWHNDIASRDSRKMLEYSINSAEVIEFNKFIQYTFFYQWQKIKQYANTKGIKIIGDLPFFVASDSSDTWSNRQFFKLDQKGKPLIVAGVPPDYFCKTGQLWGNPVYDWDSLALTDYSWWKMRIKQALRLYDFVRLDHFRGFEAYWEICANEKTAENGRWTKGPGKKFFESLANEFGQLPFIAEDLGMITSEVNTLKTIFAFPGMKVVQFTLPEDISWQEGNNFVYYTGTHDNDTLLGWYHKQLSQNEKMPKGKINDDLCSEIEESNYEEEKKECRKLIERIFESRAIWVIIPMQDILGLCSKARMNVPGIIEGNWKWRFKKDSLSLETKTWFEALALKYRRAKHGKG